MKRQHRLRDGVESILMYAVILGGMAVAIKVAGPLLAALFVAGVRLFTGVFDFIGEYWPAMLILFWVGMVILFPGGNARR